MGAIVGVLPRTRGVRRESLTALVSAMRDTMDQRAPLEGGVAVAYDASVALAHRGGAGPGADSVLQPLTNETGTLWLVADGEPSNVTDLRLELAGAGHRFQSACGSEVILHLYEQDGVRALERLTGSFAFALWDREEHELVLGRDRFGAKPLYIRDEPGRFAFASEVQALADGAGPAPAAVAAFLGLGFLPEPLTTAAGIEAVPPGTILRVRGHHVRAERFWMHGSVEPSGEREADHAHLGCLLRETVRAAVEGEEEVGIVLDDGLASAALLALVRPMLGRGLRTHAFGFVGASDPVRAPLARALRDVVGTVCAGRRVPAAVTGRSLSRWFQTEHHEHAISASELGVAFETAAEGDQPSIGAPLAQLAAASMRLRGERVWLSALAAPGLLGRSRPGAVSWLWRAARHHPTYALASAGAWAAACLRPFGRGASVAGYLAHGESVAAAYLAARGVFAPRALAAVVRPEVLAQAQAGFDPVAYLEARALRAPGPSFATPPCSAGAALARAVAAVELAGPLMSGALRDVETAAATNGLALRVPFLDHRLFEWLAAGGAREAVGPLAEVVRGAVQRALLRGLVRPTSPPVAAWMRGELRPLVEAHLFGDDPEGFFLRAGTESLWAGFLAGRVDWRPVWSLATLRAWIGVRRVTVPAGQRDRSAVRRRAAA